MSEDELANRYIPYVADSLLSFYQSGQHDKETDLLPKIFMKIDIKAIEERVSDARRLLVENFKTGYDHYVAVLF
ncbi:unnamed protein product [Ceratitis capitata]|uniref:(Mediterranean fruit fly) hypothetical protein n=1 Tax=Ceratitis capitata TaxID=7213 RepID=A0A811UGB9_CERCA|nr:unnamed protein product [Ceratitis capitata]